LTSTPGLVQLVAFESDAWRGAWWETLRWRIVLGVALAV
jgi:hypothetical protein